MSIPVTIKVKQILSMVLFAKFVQFLQSTSLFGANSEEPRAKKNQNRGIYKRINLESEAKQATDFKEDFRKSRSVDDILDDIGLNNFHIKAFIILGFINITDALEISIFPIVLPSIKSDLDISSLLAGVLTLSLSTGMIAGSSFCGWICDKFGRKCGLIGSTSLTIVFAFLSALSFNYYWLWISLFLVGFGVSNVAQTHVMTMELFPPKYRSFFTELLSLYWALGFLLSAIASTQLSRIGYHWALAIVCFPTALSLMSTVAFLPETPHYHVTDGDEQKALNVLQKLAPEMDLSNTTLNRDTVSRKRADISQLFKSGYWKITIGACIVSFTLFIVYYVLIYTSSDIARHGFRENTTSMSSTLLQHNSTDNLYSIMAWMNLPEFLIITAAGMMCYIFTVKCTLITVYALVIILLVVAVIMLNYRTALLVITLLSRSALASGVAVIYVYVPLLYPTENRSTAVGFCIAAGRIGMILGPFLFEVLFEKAYLKAIVFSIGSLLPGLLATLLLPSCSSRLN